jgi:hypothetical protein
MMATRFTTLHTPWDTGDTRARVLKANWLYRWYSRPTLRYGRGRGGTMSTAARSERGWQFLRQACKPGGGNMMSRHHCQTLPTP